MGSWGVGLYANDKAQDIRIDAKYYFWKYGEKALEKILELYYEADVEDTENDNVNVWVAIADFMWKNGILTEEVKAYPQSNTVGMTVRIFFYIKVKWKCGLLIV